jgi:hypothetical protein
MRGKAMLAVGLAALLAGCSTSVGGTPTPAQSSSTASSTGSSTDVPRVTSPIDTSKFEKEPCAALMPAQLADLGIGAQPKPDLENKLGPGCTWNGLDEPAGLSVTGTLLTIGGSLRNLYKKHAAGELPYFEPVPDVSGYPGALVDDLDSQPKGDCAMEVAVRDDLLYSVQVSLTPSSKSYAAPCPVAQKAAEMAISTMKAGA